MSRSSSVLPGRRGGARRSAAALSIVALLAWASGGCSLVYARGPQPDMHPPPPCTPSDVHAYADTALAVVSVAAAVAGGIVYANGTKKQCSGGEWFCGMEEQVGGGGALILGGIGTLIFVPSAIVGYNRAASCRAWLQANPQYAPPPAPPEASSLLVPSRPCLTGGDAPRLCASAASWESSASAFTELRASH